MLYYIGLFILVIISLEGIFSKKKGKSNVHKRKKGYSREKIKKMERQENLKLLGLFLVFFIGFFLITFRIRWYDFDKSDNCYVASTSTFSKETDRFYFFDDSLFSDIDSLMEEHIKQLESDNYEVTISPVDKKDRDKTYKYLERFSHSQPFGRRSKSKRAITYKIKELSGVLVYEDIIKGVPQYEIMYIKYNKDSENKAKFYSRTKIVAKP